MTSDRLSRERYPWATVLSAATAGCFLVTLIAITVLALLSGIAKEVPPTPGVSRAAEGRYFVGSGAAAAFFLVLFLTAWYIRDVADDRRPVWDILGLSSGLVVASALLLMAIILALVVRQNEPLVQMIAALTVAATRLRLDALAASFSPEASRIWSDQSVTLALPQAASSYLAAAVWITGRSIALLAGFAAALVVTLCSLALLDRRSELLPRWLQLAGVASLPLAALHPLVLFGTAPYELTLPALALTVTWFAVLTFGLIREAELELEMLRRAG